MNYRREDTSAAAGRLYDRLVRSFSKDAVFMDVDAISPGANFVQVLDHHVGRATIFLAVIGSDWMTVKNAQGVRRIDAADDFVRTEIASAIKRGIKVIPVLIDNADMPSPRELPSDIQALSHLNAVRIRHERFDDDADTLVRSLGGNTKDAAQRAKKARMWRSLAAAILIGGLLSTGAYWLYNKREQEPSGSNVDKFVGTWRNVNSETDGITRVNIQSRLNSLIIKTWGSCHPTDCEHPPITTSSTDSDDKRLSIARDTGFSIGEEAYILDSDTSLRVVVKKRFTDGSGRPNTNSTYYFTK
ncbi:MAG: toll/interleukin-1 receptor domain-containing protein [Hyphomicrobium sp.]|uniref:toll/interleukin-1 receptor domain-containing protein n=1 Tax=Hyphomicrobium sp. TaxID=82 RepID=UPI003D0D16E1